MGIHIPYQMRQNEELRSYQEFPNHILVFQPEFFDDGYYGSNDGGDKQEST